MLEAFIIDVNGIARGKWLPANRLEDIKKKGVAMPRSVYALDIWGRDVAEAGLAIGTGDPDGACMPVLDSISPVTWLSRPATQVLLGMVDKDGAPFYADPRQVLASLVRQFADHGLTPVVAAELEFYLIDKTHTPRDPISPPHARDSRWHGWQSQVLSIAELHNYEPFMMDVLRACEAQNLPADTLVRENGPGQYELNLNHVEHPLLAADHAFMLKRLIKGVARKHGFEATFMAKPYGTYAGSGMHVHMSVLDRDGNNIFAADDGAPTEALHHAMGGMLASMADIMLFLAPHANSYRRLAPGTHAPTRITWGHDNRTAAIRVVTQGRATRLEHRVAGADCNPHLALAGILAGGLHGLLHKIDPGPALTGEPGENDATLPATWDDALAAFEESDILTQYLGQDYQALYAAVKRQEIIEFRKRVTDVEYDAYIGTV